jgi:hypothetical protein
MGPGAHPDDAAALGARAYSGDAMIVLIPIKTVSEMNHRCHWSERAKRMKSHRTAARLMVPPHPLPCVVTITRLSAGTLDFDNLCSAGKGVRDGIADRLGVADNDPRIQWRYEQEKVARGEYAVRVEITAA